MALSQPMGDFCLSLCLDACAVMQVFRRLLLLRLHQAERLTESFMHDLLSNRTPVQPECV